VCCLVAGNGFFQAQSNLLRVRFPTTSYLSTTDMPRKVRYRGR
jgi:hypothetical protein